MRACAVFVGTLHCNDKTESCDISIARHRVSWLAYQSNVRKIVKCAAFARKHLCRINLYNSITRVRGDQIHSIRQMSWCSVPMGRKLPSRTPFPSPHRNYPPIWLSCAGCHEIRNVNRNTQSFSVLQLSHSNCVKHQARGEISL